MQLINMKSHKEISQRPTKCMKIPLGNLIRKMCSTKHEIAQGLGKKKRQSSFTVNARKTAKKKVAGKESKLKLHSQPTTLPLLNISPFVTNHIRGYKWNMVVHSISLIFQHHLSTIFTSDHHHQLKPPTEPSNHNSMIRTIRIDLLWYISVTLATFHWFRPRLKAEAP